jgi:hypothetical protein
MISLPKSRRSRFTRIVAGLAAVGTAAVMGVVAVLPTAPAAAANLANFEPGLIMSDAIFYDSTTMASPAIQSFLDSTGASCVQGTDGSPCLKAYRETTVSRLATARCPGGYAGAANESAADIIAKVAAGCGINPQVLIVTLQKEEGLVTTTNPTAGRYRIAMGYGCPDTSSVCDSQYYGFSTQVYLAASQFRNYALNPNSYSHRAGMYNNIAFSPNSACGTSAVFIQNQATAGLYNYTPYQPNGAALAAGYGTGDNCSSYGNRNFWNYFTDWFGPTTQRAAIGSIETVSTTPTSITVSGWALDPDTTNPITVHVYLDGHPALGIVASLLRTDVGAAFHKGDLHGYSGTIPATVGVHTVCVYALDSDGSGDNPQLGCRTVNVVNHVAIGSIEAVSNTANSITVSGWALDPDTTNPITVHIYLDGSAVLGTVANDPRSDVGAVYGMGDLHGYARTIPATAGAHTLCVYALDSDGSGDNPQLGCRTVNVANHVAIGSVDTITTTASSISVAGWALDPDTTNPITVHVYLDGSAVLGTVANSLRTDVGAAFGMGDLHGYVGTISASAGRHTVCVYALDSAGSGDNPQLGCRTVNVTNQVPIGSVDNVSATATSISVAGWAIDPDTTDPITVHVYLDGSAVLGTVANSLRTDVGAAFGMGDLHGYVGTISASAGRHTLCVYALDSAGSGDNPQLGCSTVSVG